jgi:hypothetical protein
MTLGGAAAAGVRLIVWCRDCGRQVEPDPAEQARRHGAGTPTPDWRERLGCSRCGGRQVDMVVSGTKWRARAVTTVAANPTQGQAPSYKPSEQREVDRLMQNAR